MGRSATTRGEAAANTLQGAKGGADGFMEFSDFAKQRPRDFGGSTPPKSPWASQKPPLFAYRKRVYRKPAFDCVGAVKRNAPPEKASKQQSEADVTKKIALCGQKNAPSRN